MSIQALRKALKEEKIVYGSDATLRNVRKGKTKAIFLAKNCPPDAKEALQRYMKIYPITIYELDEPSTELALLCKKKFNVAVASY
ncbi:MAG TPA: ribosomal L7Ae/L30e/S12e/Gadd45 family protein [Candidatus Nanoarchaeia archaeon]|nr:ribosomal L7Ae/L30e/S12e/Gadd45 family protein [Candidatus Nanoarchaeia archaeon]